MTPPEPRRNALERIERPAAPRAGPAHDPTFFRVHGRVLAIFAAQHAISREDAIAYTPAKADARAFERLRRAGVLVEAAPGRVFLDLVRYHEAEAARQRRTWQIAFGVALTLAALAVLFYSSGTMTPQPISRP